MTADAPVVSLVWNLIRGGTEGQCARVAMGLAATGRPHRVAVFRREGFFLPRVEAVCGPVYHLDIRRLASPSNLRELAGFVRWLRNQRAALLHAWDADAAIFGAWAARGAGIPLITSRRDLGEIYPAHKQWLMAGADRHAAAVVANAQAIVDRFAADERLRAKFRVIGNVLDVDEFDRLAGEPPPIPLPDAPLVGMVARLDREKDAGMLLRAAGRLAAAHPDLRFVLAGDGPERAALEAASAALGLASRVQFLGDITWVPALVRRLAVGVLTPSSNEGLSNTLLEYMAAGIPFVATDCGGNRELAGAGGCGRIVPSGDDEALARELSDLLARPGEASRMGRAGRATICERHAPAAVCDQFAALYGEVVRA